MGNSETSDSNTVLITKYSVGDDPTDPDAGEKIQTSNKVADMKTKRFPASTGFTLADDNCNWIKWTPMQKKCMNIKLYMGHGNKDIYMALNGPGFERGMFQFATNGTDLDSTDIGVLEYCPGGYPDCSNPNTIKFVNGADDPKFVELGKGRYPPDLELIDAGGGTANGWVRLYDATGPKSTKWVDTDFSPWANKFGKTDPNNNLFGATPFCNKTDITGTCTVDGGVDYMTLDTYICGNIYPLADQPKDFDFEPYDVTTGPNTTCGTCKQDMSYKIWDKDPRSAASAEILWEFTLTYTLPGEYCQSDGVCTEKLIDGANSVTFDKTCTGNREYDVAVILNMAGKDFISEKKKLVIPEGLDLTIKSLKGGGLYISTKGVHTLGTRG